MIRRVDVVGMSVACRRAVETSLAGRSQRTRSSGTIHNALHPHHTRVFFCAAAAVVSMFSLTPVLALADDIVAGCLLLWRFGTTAGVYIQYVAPSSPGGEWRAHTCCCCCCFVAAFWVQQNLRSQSSAGGEWRPSNGAILLLDGVVALGALELNQYFTYMQEESPTIRTSCILKA